MRMRSFILTLLTACLCLFGPMAAADPAPDGPGYVLPMDLSEAPVSLNTETSKASPTLPFADPSGGVNADYFAELEKTASLAATRAADITDKALAERIRSLGIAGAASSHSPWRTPPH